MLLFLTISCLNELNLNMNGSLALMLSALHPVITIIIRSLMHCIMMLFTSLCKTKHVKCMLKVYIVDVLC